MFPLHLPGDIRKPEVQFFDVGARDEMVNSLSTQSDELFECV